MVAAECSIWSVPDEVSRDRGSQRPAAPTGVPPPEFHGVAAPSRSTRTSQDQPRRRRGRSSTRPSPTAPPFRVNALTARDRYHLRCHLPERTTPHPERERRRYRGCRGRTRTRTPRRSADFKSAASDQFRHPGRVSLFAERERKQQQHDERRGALGDDDLLVPAQDVRGAIHWW